MNNKITKQRLKTFFVYDAVKATAIVALVLLLVIIVFNYVGKRPTASQTFSVLVDNVEVIAGDGQEEFYTKVSYGNKDKLRYGLSYEILTGNVTSITPSSGNPMETLVQTYVSMEDDDVLIAGKTIATYYLNRGVAMDFDLFIALLNDFLYKSNGFYSSESDSAEDINVDAVKAYFLKTKGKDTRFLTESQKQKGIENEVERIKGYKVNSDLFKRLLNKCPSIISTEKELSYFEIGNYYGKYALDLGVLGNGFINVYKTKQTVNGEQVDTTSGVYLLLGNRDSTKSDTLFETLAFILALVEDYSNVLEG